ADFGRRPVCHYREIRRHLVKLARSRVDPKSKHAFLAARHESTRGSAHGHHYVISADLRAGCFVERAEEDEFGAAKVRADQNAVRRNGGHKPLRIASKRREQRPAQNEQRRKKHFSTGQAHCHTSFGTTEKNSTGVLMRPAATRRPTAITIIPSSKRNCSARMA